MKTEKKTRVSFSGKVLSIELPKSWPELTQEELRGIYDLKAEVEPDHFIFRAFCLLSGCRVIRHAGDGFLCAFPVDGSGDVPCMVKPIELVELLDPLSFLMSPGDVAVRLDSMRGCSAVDAQLHGVSFGDYITLDNLYQGFIASRSDASLVAMARKLYPGIQVDVLSVAEQLNILNWFVQLKTVFSSAFPHFFRPVKDGDGNDPMSPLEVMNNEIRILTGGDVTKEKVVLAIDCWRALTELDFKAKEATEMKERMNKK